VTRRLATPLASLVLTWLALVGVGLLIGNVHGAVPA
jgi:hypothetical protein